MPNKTDSFQSRLKAGLDFRGMNQSELSKQSGVSKSSISRYISGAWEAKQDAVYLLAMALNVSEAWLMGYDVPMERSQPVAPSKNNTITLPDNIIPLPKNSKTVPLLGSIACGSPILAEENIEAMLPLPDFIRADFALRCKGDSMVDARILDGDLVYIRKQPDVENGEVAAVLINDEATLKRVYKHNSQIVLQPANPAYPPMVYTGEEINDIRILGKAVYFVSAVR